MREMADTDQGEKASTENKGDAPAPNTAESTGASSTGESTGESTETSVGASPGASAPPTEASGSGAAAVPAVEGPAPTSGAAAVGPGATAPTVTTQPAAQVGSPAGPAVAESNAKKIGKELASAASHQAKVAVGAIHHYFTRRGSIWTEFPEVFRGIYSSDPETRKMSVFFIVCLLGIIIVTFLGIQRYLGKKMVAMIRSDHMSLSMEKFFQKESDEKKYLESEMFLGKFVVNLETSKTATAMHRYPAGVMNMAEFEVFILCDSKETRNYVENHMVQMRSQLAPLMMTVTRPDVVTREGKKKLRSDMMRRLNNWLPHGKVEDLYFSKLIID